MEAVWRQARRRRAPLAGRSPVRALAALACAWLLGAGTLQAQGEDTTPPTFLGLANTTYTGATTPQAPASFSACDDGVLTASSLQVWLNGTNISSRYAARIGAGNPGCSGTQHSFAIYDRNTSTPLNHGANTFRVYVCDDFGNCADKTYTYTWSDAIPTVSFSPPGQRFATPTQTVDVTFSDDISLNTATRQMVLNGVNVTSSFTLYNSSATTATYRGTITLAASGNSTFQASISDGAGQSSGLVSTTYSVGQVAPTLSFSAATRTSGLTTPVTVTAHEDDQALQPASIWLNGAPYTTGIVVTQPSQYDATYSSQMPLQLGDNWVKAKVCSAGGCTTDSTRIFRYTADRAAPAISLDPTNQDWRLPSSTEAAQAYSTPAYVSRDQPRSVTLTYSSGVANPIAFVQVDASDYSNTPPSQMSISVKDANGVTITGINGATTNWYQAANGTARLGFRFSTYSNATGALSFTAVVRSYWSDGTYLETTTPVRIINLNKVSSAYGAGWDIAGLQRIYQQGNRSLVVDDGDGAAGYFTFVACYDANGNPVGAGGTCKWTSPPGDFSTVVQYLDAGATYKRTYLNGSWVTYNSSGWMTQSGDAFGNTTTYQGYTQTGSFGPLLGSIVDPAGKTITIGGTSGRLSTITGPDSRVSSFTYVGTTAPDLTAVTGPDNNFALRPTYVSGPAHIMGGWTDKAGGTWTLGYDAHWELQSVTAPAAALSVGGTPQASTTQIRSVAALVVPAGTTTQAAPAARMTPGNAWLKITAPMGDSATALIDHWAAAWKSRDQKGVTTVVLRNANGQDTMSISATGDTVRKTWVGSDLMKVTTSDGEDNYTYDAAHQLVQVIAGTATGQDVYYWRGPNERVDTASAGSGKIRYTYDSHGRVLTTKDDAGRITRIGYEAAGFQNADTLVTPSGSMTRVIFNTSGLPQTVTDAKGHVTTSAYDALNRVTTTAGALSDTTTSLFGPAYRTSVTDAVHQSYGFSPNVLGWDLQSTHPGTAKTTRRTYNPDRTLAQVTDRRGLTVSMRYDALRRLAAVYADGDSTTFAYDTAGTYKVVRNAVSEDTVRFDAAGRTTSMVSVRGGRRYFVNMGWTGGTKVAQFASELGAATASDVRYRYEDGLLARIVFDTGDSVFIARGVNYRVDDMILPGHIRQSFTYVSGFDDPVEVTYVNTVGNTRRLDLDRAAGERISRDSLSLITGRALGTQDSIYTYSYDAANRLGQWAKTAVVTNAGVPNCSLVQSTGSWCQPATPQTGQTHTLSWDKVGNTTIAGSSVGFGNRLALYNGLHMEYDSAGNTTRAYKLAADGSVSWDRTYTWNSLGQLTRVCTNGACTGYLYDGLGRRVARTDGAGNKVRQWILDDAGQTVLELDGAGNTLAGFTYMPGVDQPLAMNRGGQRYMYLRDHQGSVMALVDSAGNIVNKYRYDPWGGAESTVEGVANPLQYNGRDYDTSTDLYYYRARYYSPGLGRFISEDPVGLDGGINPYAYVGNDPVNNEDPSGLCKQRKPFGGKVGMQQPDGSTTTLTEGYLTCAQLQALEQAQLAEGTDSRFGRRDQMDEGPVPGSVQLGPQPGRIEMVAERMRIAREGWRRACNEHADEATDPITLAAGNLTGGPFLKAHAGDVLKAVGGITGVVAVAKKLISGQVGIPALTENVVVPETLNLVQKSTPLGVAVEAGAFWELTTLFVTATAGPIGHARCWLNDNAF